MAIQSLSTLKVSLGEETFEGGKGENYSLELGSNSFIPGFEDQLVGVKAGESKRSQRHFP